MAPPSASSSSSSNPYAPRLGCPLCTIVALSHQHQHQLQPTSSSTPAPTQLSPHPTTPVAGPSTPARPFLTASGGEVIYGDQDFTVYIERKHPVSSRGHLVVVFNAHIPSLYSLGPGDIPLLQRLATLCPALLAAYCDPPPASQALISPSPAHTLSAPASPASFSSPTPLRSPTPTPAPTAFIPSPAQAQAQAQEVHIGFITPPLRDPHLPIPDHLHAHAYLGKADLLPWVGLRALAFSALGWYEVEDLVAEIRESTSNNRVKTGYSKPRPIARVPEAGTRVGLPDGRELLAANGNRREPA